MAGFVSFMSIEAFHSVRKTLSKIKNHYTIIKYRGKNKLHGTNAAVRIHADSSVFAQSRSATLILPNDNAGFAAWVEPLKSEWAKLAGAEQITIFGEWCGKGIQKNVAIANIGKKVFAPFLIQIGETKGDILSQEKLIVDPDAIKEILSKANLPPEVVVIPWLEDSEVVINFEDEEGMLAALDDINKRVLDVEKVDPFVKETFGVEGIGEGIVYYPIFTNLERWMFSTYGFKAKGELHKVNKTKNRDAVQLDPETVESIADFVDMFVTENRCEQAVTEACHGVYDRKLIGPFLGWISKDVVKESVNELEESGLDWKMVSKEVTTKARVWYLTMCDKV